MKELLNDEIYMRNTDEEVDESQEKMLNGKKVLLGITASIAAYKCAELIRLFKKSGAEVRVIQTEDSTDFITPLITSTLSENRVLTEMVEDDFE